MRIYRLVTYLLYNSNAVIFVTLFDPCRQTALETERVRSAMIVSLPQPSPDPIDRLGIEKRESAANVLSSSCYMLCSPTLVSSHCGSSEHRPTGVHLTLLGCGSVVAGQAYNDRHFLELLFDVGPGSQNQDRPR